jgi:uncharacterized protein YtpQ (UPF0354 family)
MPMHKPLPVLIACLIMLCGCSEKQLTSAAFTREYAEKLQAAAPDFKIKIKDDLELLVTDKAGKETTTYLDNGYKEYKVSPQDKVAIMTKYIDALTEPSLQSEVVKADSVTPIIKDTAWVSEVQSSLKTKAAHPMELVYESLNPELIILYAEDSPKNLRYLTPESMALAKLDKQQLRELAVKNLRRLVPDIQIHGDNGLFMITAGGTYEASLLLLGELWQGDRMKVDGDYVVSIPSRDLLLVTGSNNRPALQRLRSLAKKTLAESSYTLTADLFVYRAGKFIKFEQPE